MADYWKSNARKYCEFCNVWFADNKVSVAHHENGLKHKTAVERRIRESRNKKTEQGVADQEIKRQLKEIEEEALKKMQQDISANPELANTDSVYSNLMKKRPTVGFKFDLESMDHVAGTDWVRKKTPDGLTYFFNMVTGAASWDEPGKKGKKGKQPEVDRYAPKEKKVLERKVWLKQLSPEGHIYYYNTVTTVSQWEKPEDLDARVPADFHGDPNAGADGAEGAAAAAAAAAAASHEDDAGEGEAAADDGAKKPWEQSPVVKRAKKADPREEYARAPEGLIPGLQQEEGEKPVYATPELETFCRWETVEPPPPPPEEEEEEEEAAGADGVAEAAAEKPEVPRELGPRDAPLSFSFSNPPKETKEAPRPAPKHATGKKLSIYEQKKLEPEFTFAAKTTPALKGPRPDAEVAIVAKKAAGNMRQRPRKAF